jgi:hypothetical protein
MILEGLEGEYHYFLGCKSWTLDLKVRKVIEVFQITLQRHFLQKLPYQNIS